MDIVPRLRAYRSRIMSEAADEIERLRRAGFGGLSYDIAEKQRQEIARQDDEIERLRVALHKSEAGLLLAQFEFIADLNFIKTFWRAELSCLHLACVAECNPMTTHCGRAAEVFEKHNARPPLTGRDSNPT